MNEASLIAWARSVPKGIPEFLEHMRTEIPGHFKHSYSGDVLGPARHWGLIQSILVVKTLAILNDAELWPRFGKDSLTDVILSFEKRNGLIVDPLINRHGHLFRIKRAIRFLTLKGLFYNHSAVAMTRSSYNALLLLNQRPARKYSIVEFSQTGIREFVSGLPWDQPWSAGSHFNHLLFFLAVHRNLFGMDEEHYVKCIDVALNALEHYYNRETGEWPLLESENANTAVNGTMKICMGLRIADRLEYISASETIIDRSLELVGGNHACDFFNNLYVMHSMRLLTDYREEEVRSACLRMLGTIRRHYNENDKGLSFEEGKAETHFYGYKFSKGKPESDLHGTAMYLWAIALINEVCDLGMSLSAPLT